MRSLTRAEINLSALQHNYSEFKRIISPKTEIMAVVKADGYGHGAVEISKVALDSGCTNLAVARFSEVTELREAGINAPILLFGYTTPDYVEYMSDNNVIASITCLENAKTINDKSQKLGKRVKAHIKVETGMGRLGVNQSIESAVNEILEISRLNGIEIEGLFTHFACADSRDKTHANSQFTLFNEILEKVEKQGLCVKYRHAANSAATIEMPHTHLDLVRPGISQYGLYPSNEVDKNLISLKPVMEIKSEIIQIRDVPKDYKISYGSTYITTEPTKIAVVPIGYADGYHRLLSSQGAMIVNGKIAPVVGRVCMDLTMIDVGHIENINVGDTVTVMGSSGGKTVSAEDISNIAQTINYEVVTGITPRVTREYFYQK